MNNYQDMNAMKTKLILTAALLIAVFSGCKKEKYLAASFGVSNTTETVYTTAARLEATFSYPGTKYVIRVDVSERQDMSEAVHYDVKVNGDKLTAYVTGLKANTTYYYRYSNDTGFGILSSEQKSFKTNLYINDHEYVDLGLPSGLLWATCNVGADRPEGYGWYFMWGSVTEGGDPDCSWANCPGNGGNSGYNADAFSTWKAANLTNDVLNSGVDAATANWGGDWRMPTTGDWKELYDNTTCTWTTEDGVAGRKFTSKADSSKYIFLPAAGYRSGTSLHNAGSYGFYWSSSLYSSSPNVAYNMRFSSGSVNPQYSINRCIGFTVRPVRTAR